MELVQRSRSIDWYSPAASEMASYKTQNRNKMEWNKMKPDFINMLKKILLQAC